MNATAKFHNSMGTDLSYKSQKACFDLTCILVSYSKLNEHKPEQTPI
jgi:hypothetical protein